MRLQIQVTSLPLISVVATLIRIVPPIVIGAPALVGNTPLIVMMPPHNPPFLTPPTHTHKTKRSKTKSKGGTHYYDQWFPTLATSGLGINATLYAFMFCFRPPSFNFFFEFVKKCQKGGRRWMELSEGISKFYKAHQKRLKTLLRLARSLISFSLILVRSWNDQPSKPGFWGRPKYHPIFHKMLRICLRRPPAACGKKQKRPPKTKRLPKRF